MEQWRDVLDYEGLYQISNLGHVKRTQRGKRLDPDKVEIAKVMLKNGHLLRDVAEFLGTSIATTSMIKNGKTWSGDVNYRPIKTKIGTDFYVYFTPCKDGKYKHKSIHRTMWEAFNGIIPKGMDINHKNLDRQDNRFDNLEVITHRENCQHAHDIYNKESDVWPRKGRYYNMKVK
jgi:hypothetical protein